MMVDIKSHSKAVDDTCGCRQLLGFCDFAHGMHVLQYSVTKPMKPDQTPTKVNKTQYCERTPVTVVLTMFSTDEHVHDQKAHKHSTDTKMSIPDTTGA